MGTNFQNKIYEWQLDTNIILLLVLFGLNISDFKVTFQDIDEQLRRIIWWWWWWKKIINICNENQPYKS